MLAYARVGNLSLLLVCARVFISRPTLDCSRVTCLDFFANMCTCLASRLLLASSMVASFFLALSHRLDSGLIDPWSRDRPPRVLEWKKKKENQEQKNKCTRLWRLGSASIYSCLGIAL